MATEYKGLIVRFGAETREFDRSVSGINSALKVAQANIRTLNNSLKFDSKNPELLKQKFESLGDEANVLKAKMVSLQTQMADQEVGSTKWMSLQRQIATTSAKLSTIENQAKMTQASIVEAGIQGSSAISKFDDSLETVTSDLKEVQRQMALNPDDISLTAKEASLLGEAIDTSEQKLQALIKGQRELGKEKIGSEEWQAYESLINQSTESLQRLRKQASNVERTLPSLGIEAQAAMDEFDNSLARVNSELKATQRALDLDPGNLDLVAREADLLGQAIETSEKKLTKLVEGQRALGEESVGSDEWVAYERQIDATSQTLGRLRTQAEVSEQKMAELAVNSKASIQALNSELEDVSSKLQDVQRNLDLDPGNIDLVTQESQLLGQALEASEQKLRDLIKSQQALGAEKVGTAEWKAYDTEIGNVRQTMQSMRSQIESTSKALAKAGVDGTASVKQWTDSLNSVSAELQDVQRALVLDPGNMDLVTRESELLAKSVNDAEQRLRALIEAQQALGDSEIGTDQWKAFDDEIKEAARSVETLRTQSSSVSSTVNEFGVTGSKAIKSVDGALDGLSSQLKEVQRNLAIDPSDLGNVREEADLLGKSVNVASLRLQRLQEAQRALGSESIGTEQWQAFESEINNTKDSIVDLRGQFNESLNKFYELSAAEAVVGSFDKSLVKVNEQLRNVRRELDLDPGNFELMSQEADLMTQALSKSETQLRELIKAQQALGSSDLDSVQWQIYEESIAKTTESIRTLRGQVAQSEQVLAQAGVVGSQSMKEFDAELDSVGRSLDDVQTKLTLDPGNMSLVAREAGLMTQALNASKERLNELVRAQRSLGEEAIGTEQWKAYDSEIKQTASSIDGLRNKLESSKTVLATAGVEGSNSFKKLDRDVSTVNETLKQTQRDLLLDPSNVSLATREVGLLEQSLEGSELQLSALVKAQRALGSEKINSTEWNVYEQKIQDVSSNVQSLRTQVDQARGKLAEAGIAGSSSMQKLDSATAEVSDELRKVQRDLLLDPSNIRLASKESKLLSQAVGTAEDKLRQLVKEQQKLGKNKIGTAEWKAYDTAIEKAEAEVRNLKGGIQSVTKETGKASKEASKLSEGFSIGVGMSAFEAIKSSLSGVTSEITAQSDAYDKLGIFMKTALKQGDGEIAKVETRLRKLADASVYDPADMINGFQRLALAGVDTTGSVMEGFTDMAASMSVSAQGFGSFMEQFGQAAASGKLQWEDLNVMLDNSPEMVQGMADALGVTITEFQKMAHEGTLSTSKIVEALNNGENGFKKFAGAASAPPKTIEAALGNLQASVVKVGERLLDMVKPQVIELMVKLADKIDGVADSIDSKLRPTVEALLQKWNALDGKTKDMIGKFLGIAAAVLTLVTGMGLLSQLGGPVGSFFSSILGSIASLASGIAAVLGPVGLLIAGIVGVAAAFASFKGGDAMLTGILNSITSVITNITAKLPEFVAQGAKIIGKIAEGIIAALPKVTQMADQIINSIVGALGTALPIILQSAGQIIGALISGIQQALPKVILSIGFIISSLVQAIVANLPKIVIAGIQVIVGLIQGITAALPEIIKVVAITLDYLVKSIGIMLPTIIQAGGQILQALINGIVTVLPLLTSAITSIVMTIATFITTSLPQLMQAGLEILNALILGITNNLPMIISAITTLITSLVSTIATALPQIIQAGIGILTALINGIVQNLPLILDAVLTIITALVTIITQNLPTIISAGIQILTALLNGVVANLPAILTAVLQIVQALIEAITQNLPVIIQAGTNLLVSLIKGLTDHIDQIIAMVFLIISVLVKAISDNLPTIISAGLDMIVALVQGLTKALPQILSAAVDLVIKLVAAIIENFPRLIQAGRDIIGAIFDGISKNWGKIGDTFGKLGDAIWDAIGDLSDIGRKIFDSIISGIGNLGSAILNKAKGSLGGLGDKLFGKKGASFSVQGMGAIAQAAFNVRQGNANSPMAQLMKMANAMPNITNAGSTTNNSTILNVNVTANSPEASGIAREVEQAITRRLRGR